MSLKIEPPCQAIKYFWHIVAFAGVGGTSCLVKWNVEKYLEKSLEKEEKDLSLNEKTMIKCVSYTTTTIFGAAVGGVLKGCRTGTRDGLEVGVIAGGVAGFIGSLGYDFGSKVSYFGSKIFSYCLRWV